MNRFACVHVRLAFWTLALVMLGVAWGGWGSQLKAQQDGPAVEAADVSDVPDAAPAVEEKAATRKTRSSRWAG